MIRLFPPNNPTFPLSTFLRPEYLRKNSNLNISTDSFSGFGNINGEEENKKTFDAITRSRDFVKDDLPNLLIEEFNLINQDNLTSILHKHGMNLSNLGFMRLNLVNLVEVTQDEKKRYFEQINSNDHP